MDPNKKISFGFNKSNRKLITNVVKEEKKLELVEGFEKNSIKIKGGVAKVNKPLVIPLPETQKSILDKIKKPKPTNDDFDNRPDSELTPDELAARELIRESKLLQGKPQEKPPNLNLILLSEDKFLLEGKSESTLDDYENIPINDFGLAMLRGMGWKEGAGIGKNPKLLKTAEPELRPKGMGLGAQRIANQDKRTTPVDKDGKELMLVKGAFAKIIAGKHEKSYCQILGLDDEAGRIIVKTTKGIVLSLNEFLIVPVTRDEFSTALASNCVKPNQKSEDVRDGRRHKSKHRSRSRDKIKKKSKKSKSHKSRKSSDSSSGAEKSRRKSKHKKDR